MNYFKSPVGAPSFIVDFSNKIFPAHRNVELGLPFLLKLGILYNKIGRPLLNDGVHPPCLRNTTLLGGAFIDALSDA